MNEGAVRQYFAFLGYWDVQRAKHWELIRQRGVVSFALLYGAAMFGIIVFAGFSIVPLLIIAIFDAAFFITLTWLNLVVCVTLGGCYGAWTFYTTDKSYLKWRTEQVEKDRKVSHEYRYLL